MPEIAPYLLAVLALVLRRRARARVRRTDPQREAAFTAGVVAAAIATSWPVDGLVSHSLTAHMAQHLALLVVAPPLLAIGSPVAGFAGLLTRARRRRAARWWDTIRPETTWARTLAWMVGAALVQTVVFLVWHIPAVFDAAADHEPLHALEHVTLLVSSVVLWWAVASPDAPRYRGAGVVVLFFAGMPGGLLGLAMLLARSPWYRDYPSLRDQQLGGSMMWGVGGGILVVLGVLLFVWWIGSLAPADEPSNVGLLHPSPQ